MSENIGNIVQVIGPVIDWYGRDALDGATDEYMRLRHYPTGTAGNENKMVKMSVDSSYLSGFLAARYSEKTDYDPNSQANQMRALFGLNKQGTIDSKVTMYGNAATTCVATVSVAMYQPRKNAAATPWTIAPVVFFR